MKNVYSIYDRVSDQFLNPEVHLNDGVAQRAFILSCANPSVPETYLRDISLVHIGTFDETTGFVEADHHRNIMQGDNFHILELRKQYLEVIKNETSVPEESD